MLNVKSIDRAVGGDVLELRSRYTDNDLMPW
jgi:hypothetical protein